MKQLLALILLFIVNFGYSQSFYLDLNKFGHPNYAKQFSADRGVIVYKDDSSSFFQILPREYYNLGNSTDTIKIKIIAKPYDSPQRYSFNCLNCKTLNFNAKYVKDTLFFDFTHKNDTVRFIASIEKQAKNMHSAPLIVNAIKDSTIGYVRIINTFIRYASCSDFPNVNLACVDKNFNGKLDGSDLLSLSNEDYFFTVNCFSAKSFDSVRVVRVNGKNYELIFYDNWKLDLTKVSEDLIPDVLITDSVENIDFDGINLYSLLNQKDYILINYWSEYCLPCLNSIPELNDLSNHMSILGLYYGDTELSLLQKKIDFSYVNLKVKKEWIDRFNLNGFPNYIVIDKDYKIVLNTFHIDEVKKFIDK